MKLRLPRICQAYLLLPVVLFATSDVCFSQWTKTVDCPEGRLYRDERPWAGRIEYCEQELPGSLFVKDGPYRSWFSPGHPGSEGTYDRGRRVGEWRVCNRFGRCRNETYELSYYPEETRNVVPEIPLSYSRGKYVFDFGSCWSTWITHRTAQSSVDLNIYSGLIRCQITYTPAPEGDRYTVERNSYFCAIPYSVGIREFESLDLRRELPKVGLPQFCRQEERPGTTGMPGAQAFAISVYERFLDGRTKKMEQAWTTLANLVDVECVSIDASESGPDLLTVRLNKYAEELVLDRMGKDQLKAEVCFRKFPLSFIETTPDGSGHTLFVYGLSQNRRTSEQQRQCIAAQVELQPSCASH